MHLARKLLDCVVKDLKGKIIGHFSWVTNITVTKENVYEISRGGRARWKVESAPQAHKEVLKEHKLCA